MIRLRGDVDVAAIPEDGPWRNGRGNDVAPGQLPVRWVCRVGSEVHEHLAAIQKECGVIVDPGAAVIAEDRHRDQISAVVRHHVEREYRKGAGDRIDAAVPEISVGPGPGIYAVVEKADPAQIARR